VSEVELGGVARGMIKQDPDRKASPLLTVVAASLSKPSRGTRTRLTRTCPKSRTRQATPAEASGPGRPIEGLGQGEESQTPCNGARERSVSGFTRPSLI